MSRMTDRLKDARRFDTWAPTGDNPPKVQLLSTFLKYVLWKEWSTCVLNKQIRLNKVFCFVNSWKTGPPNIFFLFFFFFLFLQDEKQLTENNTKHIFNFQTILVIKWKLSGKMIISQSELPHKAISLLPGHRLQLCLRNTCSSLGFYLCPVWPWIRGLKASMAQFIFPFLSFISFVDF